MFMIAASDNEKTQEVFIKTDFVEIKSEAEEAGGNWHENVRIVDVRSENSIPNPNLVESSIQTVPPVKHITCKYCPTEFSDPFGKAKLSHHVMTFHMNQNPDMHIASPQSNMSTPPRTSRPLGAHGTLGTPGFPGQLVGQNRSLTPKMLFQNPVSGPTSTFIPPRPDVGPRRFVSQQALPPSVIPNAIMHEYMLRQQERERIRYQQTMDSMHPGAQQVIYLLPTYWIINN